MSGQLTNPDQNNNSGELAPQLRNIEAIMNPQISVKQIEVNGRTRYSFEIVLPDSNLSRDEIRVVKGTIEELKQSRLKKSEFQKLKDEFEQSIVGEKLELLGMLRDIRSSFPGVCLPEMMEEIHDFISIRDNVKYQTKLRVPLIPGAKKNQVISANAQYNKTLQKAEDIIANFSA
jgi:uncharacterized protein YggU (UPF0235/DUF167 family)